ncbi:MAG: aspartate dehydrogenase [Steroidobacterales bacterium]
MSAARRVGLIGYGAIARALLQTIAPWQSQVDVVGIIRKNPGAQRTGSYPCCGTIGELLALRPDLVVECAGHDALGTLGPRVLLEGIDLLVASTGALADPSIETALRGAAAQSGSRAFLVAGAVGGLDALGAARHAGLEQVRYVGRKPPEAWRGTAAKQQVDLRQVTGSAVLVFEGTARQAALRFPQNANVAAAVALAGLGFEQTQVQLFADPTISGNLHRIEAHGAFGRFEIELSGIALPDNPKTSHLTVGSLSRALADPRELIVFA